MMTSFAHEWDLKDFGVEEVHEAEATCRKGKYTYTERLRYKRGVKHPKPGHKVGLLSLEPVLHVIAVGTLKEIEGPMRKVRLEGVHPDETKRRAQLYRAGEKVSVYDWMVVTWHASEKDETRKE
jgi:hypothetical protein